LVLSKSCSKGSNRFRFKFVFDGDYYFWIVDDVRLVRNNNDMKINPNWVAWPTRRLQTNNVDTVRFMADITNTGATVARNVRLKAQVFNTTTKAEVFSATKNYGNLNPDSTAENGVFSEFFVPPTASIGSPVGYDIMYSVTSDSADNYPLNDTLRYNSLLVVNDTIQQHDKAAFILGYAPGGTSWTGTQLRSWKIGNYFFLPKGTTTNASSITGYISGLNQVTTARTYQVGLYEWRDLNRNDSVELNERTLVAAGERVVAANPTSGLLTIKLENAIGSGPLRLKDNQAYLAMFEINPTVAAQTWFMGFGDALRWDYAPMETANALLGRRRYVGFFNANANTSNAVWTPDFYTSQYVPLISLNIHPIRTGVQDDLPTNVKMTVYPRNARRIFGQYLRHVW
jgi:hypothetical protein